MSPHMEQTMNPAVQFYAAQSAVSDPGAYAHLLDDMPHDPAGVSRVVQGLVYHYVADPYIFGHKPPKERMPEIDTRGAEPILARLVEMDTRSLDQSRAYADRIVGCCRDFALLACSMLRYHGVPARLRYGFSSYFIPDYWIDHVVVEAWNGERWQRFDPEVPQHGGLGFDILDVPTHTPDAPFVTGGRAWQMCRDEGADPVRFGLGPDLPDVAGWFFVRGRLQLDMAALNKQEMLCWDEWGYGAEDSTVTDDDAALLDRAAALSLNLDTTDLRTLLAAEPRLHLPAQVTCFSPAVGPHAVAV